MSELVQIREQISRLFVEEMNLAIPSQDTDLLQSGDLDSLTFVDLLVHLETKFGVKISIDKLEMGQFRSISKIAELVMTHNGVNEARAA